MNFCLRRSFDWDRAYPAPVFGWLSLIPISHESSIVIASFSSRSGFIFASTSEIIFWLLLFSSFDLMNNLAIICGSSSVVQRIADPDSISMWCWSLDCTSTANSIGSEKSLLLHANSLTNESPRRCAAFVVARFAAVFFISEMLVSRVRGLTNAFFAALSLAFVSFLFLFNGRRGSALTLSIFFTSFFEE